MSNKEVIYDTYKNENNDTIIIGKLNDNYFSLVKKTDLTRDYYFIVNENDISNLFKKIS